MTTEQVAGETSEHPDESLYPVNFYRGIADMLHSYAFSNLHDETRETHPEIHKVLNGFSPGPGGNWNRTVPSVPDVAYDVAHVLAGEFWGVLAEWWEETVRNGPDADLFALGQDCVLDTMGTGAGLWDGDWVDPPEIPDHGEPLDYYVGDDGRIYAYSSDLKHGGHTAVWEIVGDSLNPVYRKTLAAWGK